MPSDDVIRFKLRLSIEEAVENVVRYAYEGGIGWLEVGTRLDSDRLVLTIELRDAGCQVMSGPRTTGDGYYESCILGPEGIQIEITI